MKPFLIDEDMPRSTAGELRQAGYEVADVRDVGLRGHSDEDIFAYAQAQESVLITADKDYSDIRRFPPGTHQGIMVVRVPDVLPTKTINHELLQALANLSSEDVNGNIVIVELGRVRIRRPPADDTEE
jgi:predicted nuclease of predicted toxin-antitoxin system